MDRAAIGVGVIGTGYWGRNLVRNFHALGALRVVCDKNAQALSEMLSAYPGALTDQNMSSMLARPEVDAVVVATPAETHFTLAREALLAGKHVLVEKPLTLVEDEARELISIASRKNLTLMVGHLLHYHPVFEKLKQLCSSGELGRIDYIYSHRLNLGKIRREENILWSFAPHDISMILALAGEEPDSVLATGGNYLHRKIADITVTQMDFATGLKAHIFVSWLHPFKEQKLVVVGNRKMAVFDDGKPWEEKLLIYPHEIRWEGGMPVPTKAEAERLDIARDEPLKRECQHFLDCSAGGTAAITGGEEGLGVLRVLTACQRSLDGMGDRIWLASSKGQPDRAFFAHETAVLDPQTSVGAGTKIWHFSHILNGSSVGKKVNIGQNVVVGPDVRVGDGCKIQNNVSIYPGVTLEEDVFCGPSMVFTNVHNPRANIPRMDEKRATLVRKGATLGANCTIVCGRIIGRHAFVGAGAVVTHDVMDHALVVGNPARQVGWMCSCGIRLSEDLTCPACLATYRRCENGLAQTGEEECS